eukprot:322507-Chlamydomonas_euryale.AAC.1
MLRAIGDAEDDAATAQAAVTAAAAALAGAAAAAPADGGDSAAPELDPHVGHRDGGEDTAGAGARSFAALCSLPLPSERICFAGWQYAGALVPTGWRAAAEIGSGLIAAERVAAALRAVPGGGRGLELARLPWEAAAPGDTELEAAG